MEEGEVSLSEEEAVYKSKKPTIVTSINT